jgi:hypothetical protein
MVETSEFGAVLNAHVCGILSPDLVLDQIPIADLGRDFQGTSALNAAREEKGDKNPS